MLHKKEEHGSANPLVIVVVVLVVLVLGLSVFGIWAYMNYSDQKMRVDLKIAAAVTAAQKQQGDADAAQFAEQEKQPFRTFEGTEDLGHVQFSYPKTWSVYTDRNGANVAGFEVYFQPLVVPPLSSGTPYALRVSIVDDTYEQVLNGYGEFVRAGSLKSSPITLNGVAGIRLDGNFSASTKGSMVILKIRDKTLRIFTESQIFVSDFDNTILKTLRFNK